MMKTMKFSRLDIFKIYKTMCKKFHASCLSYGPLTKKDARDGVNVIWAEVDGEKLALFTVLSRRMFARQRFMFLSIRKDAGMPDVQLQVVKRILNELKKNDVRVGKCAILKGYEFEAGLLDFDLNA